MILALTDAANLMELLGNGIILATGQSIIILAIVIVLFIAWVCWSLKTTMQETYLLVFVALGLLRLTANDASFNDVGIFALLHNLLIFGSALVWAKILTNPTERG